MLGGRLFLNSPIMRKDEIPCRIRSLGCKLESPGELLNRHRGPTIIQFNQTLWGGVQTHDFHSTPRDSCATRTGDWSTRDLEALSGWKKATDSTSIARAGTFCINRIPFGVSDPSPPALSQPRSTREEKSMTQLGIRVCIKPSMGSHSTEFLGETNSCL